MSSRTAKTLSERLKVHIDGLISSRTDVSNRTDEREALIALYDATGGTNWSHKTNWKTNQSLNKWYGVITNADGQVTTLALRRNNLSGPIPAQLAQLKNLTTLSLADNNLSGPIPAQLIQLKNLTTLVLGQNKLSGPIPTQLIQLKNLSLADNNLSGPIPAELAQLKNLSSLNLSGNKLSGRIPDQLVQLKKLKLLNLSGNAGLYAPTNAKFQAWRKNLKKFSIDDSDRVKPQPPAGSPGPALARDDVLLSDVKRDEGKDVSLETIERLLDAVKPPDDSTQTLDLLKSFLSLAETFKNKVGAIGDGAANMQVLAANIEKLQDDLTEIEKKIAEVVEQTEDAAQQQSVLEDKNAELEAELDDKKAELDDKNKECDDRKAAFEKHRSDLEEVERLLADVEIEIPRVEAAIQQINDESADLALRVDGTGQKFHDAVEKFLQSQRQGSGIIRQIGGMLRLHHGDDAQILKALRQWEDSEAADLNTALDLVDKIAENLGDLDRCLGTLTEERDSTS